MAFFAEDGVHGPRLWTSDGDDRVPAADWNGGYVSPQIESDGALRYFSSGPIAGSPLPLAGVGGGAMERRKGPGCSNQPWETAFRPIVRFPTAIF